MVVCVTMCVSAQRQQAARCFYPESETTNSLL